MIIKDNETYKEIRRLGYNTNLVFGQKSKVILYILKDGMRLPDIKYICNRPRLSTSTSVALNERIKTAREHTQLDNALKEALIEIKKLAGVGQTTVHNLKAK